ncbi:hypothetical protein [uncultured Methanofollis sp.]|uniref:hypothetical protein n=1 Tax=uncultured Methanofollis sp. TaxID=262500 RepID=UPI0026303A4A|nr:hypothetical protein [uncultured Methanofollis sp.]
MKTKITFEELAQLPFFEGVATLSLVRRGEIELFLGDVLMTEWQVEKIVEEVVRALQGMPRVVEVYR